MFSMWVVSAWCVLSRMDCAYVVGKVRLCVPYSVRMFSMWVLSVGHFLYRRMDLCVLLACGYCRCGAYYLLMDCASVVCMVCIYVA